MSRLILLFCLPLFPACLSGAEICKWVDEDGRTHYGDCSKAATEAESIEITPGPSEESQQQAQERLKKLIENQEQQKETGEPEKEIAQKEIKQETSPDYDTKCFGSPVDTTSISPRPLTSGEYKTLAAMLNMLTGYKRWKGVMKEVVCYGPEHDPPIGTGRFKVDMQVERDFRSNYYAWIMETEGNGIDDTSLVLEDVFWLLLRKDRLFFGYGSRWAHDELRYNVDIISIGTDLFRFKRYGGLKVGPQHEFQVWSFQISRKSLLIKESIYGRNGLLDRNKTWTLKR